jgi:DNA-binding transcriptional LysR family regulator
MSFWFAVGAPTRAPSEENAYCDTALSAEAAPATLETETIYQEDFVCLMGSARRVGTRRFTLKQYLDLPHALVETLQGQQTLVDRPLGELGLKRHVALMTPFFVPTIFAIARTDLVLTLPRRLAKITAAMAAMRMVEPPREIKGFPYFMVWHPRLTVEPAHVWFREQLRAAIRTKPARSAGELR